MTNLPWDPEILPKPTRDPERLKSDMSTFGFCFIEAAFDAEEVAAIRARLEEQAEAERKGGHHQLSYVQDEAGLNQWVNMLINKGKAFQATLFHPLIRGVVDHVLGAEYFLSEISASITHPGSALLPFHTDQWWMPVPQMPGDDYRRAGDITRTEVVTGPPVPADHPINPPMAINAMTMVTDFTEANGATRLLPYSHLSGRQPEPVVPHAWPSVPAAGPAGTVVLWEGRTWHAVGGNASQDSRFGLVTLFTAPQVRAMQNFTLGTKAEVLADASPELIDLLGFKVWYSYGQTDVLGARLAKPAAELIGELKP